VCLSVRVQKNQFFFKKPNPPGFLGFYWVLGFIGFLDFLFEQAVGKLVGLLIDLAHQLSFHLD